MNLHGIASGAIGSVNPSQKVALKASTGYTTAAGGKQSPTYASVVNIDAQVQELTSDQLRHVNGLGIDGILRKLWVNGTLHAVDRAQSLGGDMVTLADGTIWLVVHILEQFPDWCSAAIQKQVS